LDIKASSVYGRYELFPSPLVHILSRRDKYCYKYNRYSSKCLPIASPEHLVALELSYNHEHYICRDQKEKISAIILK
jgi:hypothetical protein